MAKDKATESGNGDLLTLRQGAAYLEVTDQRMRTVLREGRVEATKNEKGYWRVSVEALDNYKATKGRRLDGAKTWTVRLDEDQKVVMEEFVASQGWEGVEFSPRYNYDPEKAKAYRQKRKAQLAEEIAANADN